MTGARIILNVAERVIEETPIGWPDQESQTNLARELAIQCHARRDESFAGRTAVVLEAVVAAACRLEPYWPPHDPVSQFIMSQADTTQKLVRILSRVGLGYTWRIFTNAEDKDNGFHIAIDGIFNDVLRSSGTPVRVGHIQLSISSTPFSLSDVEQPMIRLVATAAPARRDTDNEAINSTDGTDSA